MLGSLFSPPCLLCSLSHWRQPSIQEGLSKASGCDLLPPVRLIWINRVEERDRGGEICLHYDGKREEGIQPWGSFLYARVIKCLTEAVDGITDCWTKKRCAWVWGREYPCVCNSVWIAGFPWLDSVWHNIQNSTRQTAFAVHQSGWPREVLWEEVRRGRWREGGDWRWEWRKMKKGGLVRG